MTTTDPNPPPPPYAVRRSAPPPPPPPARRERVPYPAPPSWLPWAALGTGAFAAFAIPDHAPGVGYVLVVAAIAGSLLAALRGSMRRSDWALGGLMLALLSMLLLRDAPWLAVLDILAVAALGTMVLAGAETFSGMVSAGATIWLRLAPALPYLLRPLASYGRAAASPKRRPVLRGVLLSVALLLVFGALFASADEAFETLVGNLVPSVDLGHLPARLVLAAFVTALVGAGLLTRLGPLPAVSLGSRGARARAEWLVPLVALDVLFAAFVAVQLAVLFGGNDHVLRTSGLTYAQYARQGFFQLVFVVLLTLAVIGFVVSRVSLVDARDRLLARVSLGTLCALTFVVLASAWRRLALYEATYDLTRLRLFVHAVIVGLGIVLALVVVAGVMWRGSWLPRACVAAMAVTLLGLNVANPDAMIARRAAETYRAGGEVDGPYLSNLSADAAPVLATLPESVVPCIRVDDDRSWLAWNLARSRGRQHARECDLLAPDRGP